jgi:hypothetical protein
MRRYLLVLDMDLLAVDEELDLEPISYLVAKQEQAPGEVVVLSLVSTGQTKLPAMELILGARSGKFPVAPRPDHDISAAAEHRMNLAVRHLKMIRRPGERPDQRRGPGQGGALRDPPSRL